MHHIGKIVRMSRRLRISTPNRFPISTEVGHPTAGETSMNQVNIEHQGNTPIYLDSHPPTHPPTPQGLRQETPPVTALAKVMDNPFQ
jgi:hypothetical protein